MFRYTIKMRMGLRLGLVLLFLVVTGLVGLYGIERANANTRALYGQVLQDLRQIGPGTAALRQGLEVQQRQLQSEQRRIRNVALGTVLAGLLLSVVFDGLFVRSVTARLRDALALARMVAEGRLDNRIPTLYSDEIGELRAAFRAMDERLSMVIRRVRDHAGTVNGAARQLVADNEALSRHLGDDAVGLQATATGMQAVAASVERTAGHAGMADRLATEARHCAEDGGEVVAQMQRAMQAIDGSSERIADIVGMIDAIAFQTRLLALNAAVEAARAGEHGRGFAVVAAEVRQLAQRCTTAAGEIKQLIADSRDKVADGSRLARQSGETLARIVHSVRELTGVVAQIAHASQQQAQGVGEASDTLGRIDRALRAHESLLGQAGAASRLLLAQAEGLSGEVAYFRFAGAAPAAALPA
jgi:methyl-accepting chemotaxis protein